ncbi:carbonyl reductase [NADPH] 3-like isoform X1 [Homalodisca vitripennis]|uniref:carbonyl reductase [NADPH] 3-like isoform X1 n=1 Tax=Homalodisca vitripennis TaxID=197043 RepID=UPI001EEB8E36|nr:carbonyl reductase [NADPH] 3-like isoform X1 [Homalodisca vitripennis]
MPHTKVAIVTGSNQGIGLEIVKNLCEKFPGVVFLTSRDIRKGEDAVEALKKLSLKPEYHQLDVLDKESIARFAKFIKEKYGGIDVLVNNAAIAYQVDSPEPFGEQAEVTLTTNYFGLLAVCHALFPLLRPHARVVNLSSSEGHLSKIPGEAIRDRLRDPDLTEEGLTCLVKEFIDSAKAGTYNETGWGRSSYRVSKNAVNALTFLQQKAFDRDSRSDIVVNAVHPGFCTTNMTRHKGVLTPQQGADAPAYLALLPPNVSQPRGQYVWKDRTIVSWIEPLKERF